jgi:uncharacterized protein YbcI
MSSLISGNYPDTAPCPRLGTIAEFPNSQGQWPTGNGQLHPANVIEGTVVANDIREESIMLVLSRKVGESILITAKTQGELEAAICKGISQFEQHYMGRGPKDVRAHLIGDLLVVRLQSVLTAAEQQLVKSLPAEKGRDLVKHVRSQLIESARPLLEGMVKEVTGVMVLSLHYDISTVTGEEIVLFTLAESPDCRAPKNNRASESAGNS